MMTRLLRILAVLAVFVGEARSQAGLPAGADTAPAGVKALQQRWQTGRYCGVNSLYYLLRLEGFPVDYDEVASVTTVNEKGSSLEDLHQAALRVGMPNEVGKVTPDDLRKIDLPVIAHITNDRDEGHYVVLLAIHDQENPNLSTVKIIDGTSCRFEQRDLGYFVRMWTGYVLAPRESRLAGFMLYAIYGLTGLLVAGCLVLLVATGSRRVTAARAPGDEADRIAVGS